MSCFTPHLLLWCSPLQTFPFCCTLTRLFALDYSDHAALGFSYTCSELRFAHMKSILKIAPKSLDSKWRWFQVWTKFSRKMVEVWWTPFGWAWLRRMGCLRRTLWSTTPPSAPAKRGRYGNPDQTLGEFVEWFVPETVHGHPMVTVISSWL